MDGLNLLAHGAVGNTVCVEFRDIEGIAVAGDGCGGCGGRENGGGGEGEELHVEDLGSEIAELVDCIV